MDAQINVIKNFCVPFFWCNLWIVVEMVFNEIGQHTQYLAGGLLHILIIIIDPLLPTEKVQRLYSHIIIQTEALIRQLSCKIYSRFWMALPMNNDNRQPNSEHCSNIIVEEFATFCVEHCEVTWFTWPSGNDSYSNGTQAYMTLDDIILMGLFSSILWQNSTRTSFFQAAN